MELLVEPAGHSPLGSSGFLGPPEPPTPPGPSWPPFPSSEGVQSPTPDLSTAFVLLSVDLAKEDEVLSELRKTAGVRDVKQLFGVYDAIAKLEAENDDGLKTLLQERIRRIHSVRSTLTLMVKA